MIFAFEMRLAMRPIVSPKQGELCDFVERLRREALENIRFSDEDGLDYCADGEEFEGCGGWFRHRGAV